jgi:hypothetical protein
VGVAGVAMGRQENGRREVLCCVQARENTRVRHPCACALCLTLQLPPQSDSVTLQSTPTQSCLVAFPVLFYTSLRPSGRALLWVTRGTRQQQQQQQISTPGNHTAYPCTSFLRSASSSARSCFLKSIKSA